MAGELLARDMPKGLNEEEAMQYFVEHYEGAVENLLAEIEWTMKIIEKQEN